RGQDPEGGQARRSARRAADEVRAGDQSQNREGTGAHDPAVGVAPGRQGDRVTPKPWKLPGNSRETSPERPQRHPRWLSRTPRVSLGFRCGTLGPMDGKNALITQRSLAQIQPPQPRKVAKPKGSAVMIGRPLWPSMKELCFRSWH